MKDKQTIIIILLTTIILGVGLFYFFNQVTENAYEEGVEYSVQSINQLILKSLQTNGYVSFSYPDGEEIKTITLVPYQQPNE